ncbi:MAG: metallophosphoesterase family protein [Verrucomicrobiota bacterium JB023]|nr:metallophosphoesterase family protein [Verrucomicrobiota bacterium JB023]
MTYVFGDIHGCRQPLENLLKRISPGKDDLIITLGDYVDRGPDSRGVLDLLLDLQSHHNLVALTGNHEIMMLDALEGPPSSGFWLLNGGIETLESYQNRKLSSVPEAHWDFIRNLDHIYQQDDLLFTHATPDPQRAIDEFDEEDIYWNRYDSPPAPRQDGLLLVCGHTPTEDGYPLLLNRHLCLDTGAAMGGYLTAMTMETGTYLQENIAGKTREGQVFFDSAPQP